MAFFVLCCGFGFVWFYPSLGKLDEEVRNYSPDFWGG